MSCGEVGQHKDSITWPVLPGSSSGASRCVPDLKIAPQAKALGQAVRPLSQNVPVFSVCSAQGVAAI